MCTLCDDYVPKYYMTFCIERLVSNEVGRVHWYCDRIFARSWEEAEVLTDLFGWRLSGEFCMEVDAGPALSAACDAIVEQRDKDWVGG